MTQCLLQRGRKAEGNRFHKKKYVDLIFNSKLYYKKMSFADAIYPSSKCIDADL